MIRLITRLAILLPACLLVSAQAPPEPSYTGCVMVTEAGDYTFCEPANCSALLGKLVGPKLAGHTVTLHGAVQAPTSNTPRIITVTSVVSIGTACEQRCSPTPPGHRGLGHEHPGAEGGTPGVTTTPPPRL
jgi:hypothetical protein